MIVECYICGNDIDTKSLSVNKRYRYKKTGRYYCSLECSNEYRSKRSSETMAKTNKIYASDRMKTNNPMFRKEIRDKVSEIHKTNGYKPKIQGGNGREMPLPQKILLKALGNEWIGEYCVSTKIKRNNNPNKYPTVYKIDIANPDIMIAVEVDGSSHHSSGRKQQDEKKDQFLVNKNWKVIRIKNQEVLNSIQNCVERVLALQGE